MSGARQSEVGGGDTAPGDPSYQTGETAWHKNLNYLIGLAFAVVLTGASFYAASSPLIWAPAIPAALVAFAVAQIGVHLVFFLHLTTAPDNTNNVMALAFGILIVFLVVAGSVWIMSHLSANMMPMDRVMQMQR